MQEAARDTGEARSRAWRQVINARQLFVLPVLPLFALGQHYGWIAHYPMWVPIGGLFAAQLLASVATLSFPTPRNTAQMVARIAMMMCGVTLCIYATGWGAVFAIGLAFQSAECMETMGSRVTRPCMVLIFAFVALGETTVLLGWSRSMLPEPQGTGVAVLEALGAALLTLMLGLSARAKETAADELRRREERFRALVQHGTDVILVIDRTSRLAYASPSIRSVLGHDPDDAAWFTDELVHVDDRERMQRFIRDVITGRNTLDRLEARLRHADGSFRTLMIGMNNRLGDASVKGLVCNLHDITDRKRAEAELAHQAYYDTLTSLPNRAHFIDRLDRALRVSEREQTALAVMFLDVDRFKLVNDSLGHEAGDRLLELVAERLEASVRPGDTVARFGGDEFTVLLERVESTAAVIAVAERITEQLRVPISVDGRDLTTSTSIGIAVAVAGSESGSELLRRADMAMYLAKDRGRSRWELFDANSAPHVVERLELEGELARAIDCEELVVYFQPEYSLTTGRVVGAEALVRWQHPTRGLLPPSEFVPLAEESSLILAVDRYVLRAACRAAREWSRECPPGEHIAVSVNLSPRSVRQADAAGAITAVIREFGVDPRSVQLEITERTALTDLDRTVATLHELRSFGIRVAIDDFGTGYSSLGYLKRLPVDVVKLDRSFVESLYVDDGEGAAVLSADVAIVQAVITMGHALGMKVTAEGIERESQVELLAHLGCDRAMGWFWSQAMRADEFVALVRDEHALPVSAR